MLDQQKAEAIAKKQWKNKGESSLLVENNRYYDINISSTDSDQKKGLNLLKN